MAYKKLFKELFEQYTAKYKRKPKGLELIKIKLKAADLQRESDKLIEFPRNKIQPLDPDDALPNYKETPGEYSRRETPGSIENLREEMKIAYRNEFDRLTGNETAEELTEMLKNLDIDGVPFAGGGVVKKIIKSLTMKNKDPMDSMKELNEVLKRKKELDLSDDQVDEIMEAGNDWIFQRDPDNLFIPGKSAPKSFFDDTVEEVITEPSEVDMLMKKYPGMNIKLATQIANDTNPKRKSDVIAMVEQTMEMSGKGMGGDEIIDIFKKTPRTKQAGGGLLKKVLKDYQKYLKTRKERPSKKRFKEIPFRKFFEIYGPENFADGGQAKPEDVSLSDFLKVQGSGSISGKQDMYSTGEKSAVKLPEGITSNESFINLIANLDIPISEKISLLGDVQYNKSRNKIKKGNEELFLEDPASSVNRKIGIGYDSGTGITGSAKYGIDDEGFMLKIAKSFSEGGSTSTGLNYLLGEDDTNSRVPYATGGRRGFLKLLAGLGAAGAAFKTGLMSLGKGAAKPAAKVAAEQVAKSGAPPHFFKLVAKIKALGDESTAKYATKDREVVTNYKDYTLTEDITTGEKTIQRFKQSEIDYYDEMLMEETYMSHTPGKGQMDETTKGRMPPDEYIEDTSYLRTSGPQKGDILETIDGVPEDVLKEVGETIVKKAEGGRIDRSGGGIMKIIKKLVKPKKKKLETVKDFVDKRKFLKSMVGETEKNKKARQLAEIKEAVEEARKNPGFKFKDIDVDKEIKPIFDQSKDRTLNAGGGIITKLIKKLNTIDPGSTKRGKLSKPMSKKAKDKKQLREAIENFSKRNRAR